MIRNATTALILAVGSLVALSLTMLLSATMLDRDPSAGVFNQTVATVAGLVALVTVAAVDYRRTGRLSWWVYALAIVLLVLVLVHGRPIKGARRWVFGVQPSELGKLALLLTLAHFGATRGEQMRRFRTGILGGGLIALPIFALVLVEPDRGTAALLGLMTLLMLLLAGVRWIFVAPPALLGVGLMTAVVFFSPMASNRIDAWLHPENHRQGAGHQVLKSLYAFAAGGLDGRGLGQGTLKYRVPEVETDFVLPAIGEELGLPFTLGVVAAYLVILVAGSTIASRAPDRHGMLLAAGVTFLIAAQASINIGVVTGVLPNKGMPLPFISRGGSSIAVMLTFVGILLSVARQITEAPAPRRHRSVFGDPEEEPAPAR